MHEIALNLHVHTRYSDGGGSHRDIAVAALRSGIDAVLVTDHNVLVDGLAGYVKDGGRRVLMLIGEEVHDQVREPQKNHLLVFGARKEVASLADDPSSLIQSIQEAGGLSFIAHPSDPAAPAFGESDISWVDWSIGKYTGLELWNGLSELKTLVPAKAFGLLYGFFPSLVAHSPPTDTLRKWDQLTLERRIVGIGGSDAHAMRMHIGPLHRIVYAYDFHFRAINTHVLLQNALTGNAANDEKDIYAALAAGHCFVAYDLPSPTHGFRFTAHGREREAIMGDEIAASGGVTLHARLPSFADVRLVRNGMVVHAAQRVHALTYHASQQGVYRIEAYRRFRGRLRGWIFSNPIYVR